MTLVSRIGGPIVVALTAGMAAAVPVQGQTLQWVHQFGTAEHDAAWGVSTDAAGNIYVGGVTRAALPGQTAAGNGDAFVARYDASGDLIWVRQFGTTREDGIVATATDAAGFVFAGGFINGETSISGTAALLAKYDAAGNQLWLRQFGAAGFSTTTTDVASDAAGNVYVVGTAGNIFGREAFLTKFSPAGAQLWSRPIATSTLDPAALATDNAGHIYVVGTAASDAVIAQYDALGNQVWLRQFGTASNDLPQDVATNALGDVYIVGLQDGYDLEASFIAQYDAAGVQQWVRAFSAENFPPWATAVAADGEGNAFIGGFIAGTFPGQTSAGTFDAFVLAYDRSGTQQWARQFGTPQQDRTRQIAVDGAGNIYLVGMTPGAFPGETNLGASDAFLARLTTAPVGISDRIAETSAALAGMAIPEGIRRSLEQKLAAAQRAADAGRGDAICGPLTAFANEVSAQDGKKLTPAQAALLRTSIGAALAAAGCPGA
jgi:hypothetical protein